MQTQIQKGELLGELRGKTITRTIKEITPLGVKIESNDEAQFAGKYNASHMETVSIFLRTNGTSEWETKAVEITTDGDFVVISGRGEGKTTSPTTVSYDGEVVFMTQSPKLGWLNMTRGWVEGTANNATGEYQGRIYTQK